MGNMSYCRFENTLSDLMDCRDHISDDLSDEEVRARWRLIGVCRDIVGEAEDNEIEG